MPRFTIVTATRDRPAELREALESTLAQDFGDFEHLVVDDAGPPGEAAEVVAALGDPRIELIRLEEPRGPAGARNAALERARGDLIAVLDDDDRMLPGRLRRTAAAFDADPELVLVAGAYRAIDADGSLHAVVRPPTDEARLRALLPRHNPICHSSVSIRADALRRLGGWREPLRYSHDYDLLLRAMELGRIRVLPDELTAYRFHSRNISTRRCLLQGAYARIARICAERRARGVPEGLAVLAAALEANPPRVGPRDRVRAEARVHYQIGEWKYLDGRTREARSYLLRSIGGDPARLVAWGLLFATFVPAWLRRLLAPSVRPLVAARYPRLAPPPA